MASSEMKSMREKFEEENIKDHQMATNEGTKTDMFTCGKCKGRSCTYNQVRIRALCKIKFYSLVDAQCVCYVTQLQEWLKFSGLLTIIDTNQAYASDVFG